MSEARAEVPGNTTGDLEDWLMSLTQRDVEDVFDMFYLDGAVQKLMRLSVRIYENEMGTKVENDRKYALELLMRLMTELQKETMARIGLVAKGPGRRKIYKPGSVAMRLKPY